MSQYPSYPAAGHPALRQELPPETKGHYDELIDDYGAPYVANSRHQTYAVEPTALARDNTHRRGPSYPLTPKSAKLSDDTTDQSHSSYPPVVPVKEKDTRPMWQKILPESLACRLYVITVLVETAIDLAIEGELLVRVNRESDGIDLALRSQAQLKMPVYVSMFAFAHVFQFIMALDAVYARNTLQFIFLAVFNAALFAYSIVQVNEILETLTDPEIHGVSSIPIKVLTTIIPVVVGVSELAYIGLGWKIYNEFGWKVYKFLGADRRLKKMYANYQIYECLVKFDVFFWAGFSIQFIWLVLRDHDWEYYVTCAALPLSLVLLIEGHLAAKHENKWMMATFMSGCVGAMVYFVYKLLKVIMQKETDTFKLVWKSLVIFSVIAIILLAATFIFSVIVLRNFGRGLKDALARKDSMQHKPSGSVAPHRRVASTNLNRMSID